MLTETPDMTSLVRKSDAITETPHITSLVRKSDVISGVPDKASPLITSLRTLSPRVTYYAEYYLFIYF